MTTRYYKYFQSIFSNQFDGFVNLQNLFLFIWYLSQFIRILQNIISDSINIIRMKSTNKMLCLVNLPNGTTFGIQCDPKAIGQRCLEEVSTQIPSFSINLLFGIQLFCSYSSESLWHSNHSNHSNYSFGIFNHQSRIPNISWNIHR